MYLANAAASVIDVALSLQPPFSDNLDASHRVAEAVLNFCLSHGIVALGSIMHHVPTAAPQSWLIRFMRVVLLFYTLNSWASVAQRIASL